MTDSNNNRQKKELEIVEKELENINFYLIEVGFYFNILKNIIHKEINFYNIKKKVFSDDFQIDNMIALTSEENFFKFLYLVNKGLDKVFNYKIPSEGKILYKATRDGFNSIEIHNKCDGWDNTITLILSNNKRLFGGFTDHSWDSFSGSKKGNKSFLFSVDNNKVYYIKNDTYSINCSKNYGPIFGLNDLVISNDCINNFKSYDHSGESYDTGGEKYSLAGTEYFSVIDYIVYQLYE